MVNTILDWPEYLLPPEPLNESYVQVLPSRVRRTEMEQGLPRQRRVVRNGPTQMQITLPFTPDQYRAFTGLLDLIDGGQVRMPIFRDNVYLPVVGQIVKDSANKVPRSGGEWLVSFVFETMQRLAPDVTELISLLWTAGTDMTLSELADRLHRIVHIDLPEAMP